MSLQLENIGVVYGQGPHAHTAVQGLNLRLERAEIGALIGPSGCGKSSLLRAIAGLQPLHTGQIASEGQRLSDARYSLPPEQRGVGMVFQDYALFPHMSVARNIAFGLPHLPVAEQKARIQEVLELVGLADLAQRMPHELSGGQQQRIALARALARKPVVLLLDEPFSSLDAAMREHLAQEIRRILKAASTTALLVTHDQSEAFAIADRIGVMHAGRLEQWDTPEAIYHRPASRFVAEFVGDAALLPVQVQTEGGASYAETAVGRWPLPTQAAGPQLMLLRADQVQEAADSPLRAQVLHSQFRGNHHLHRLRLLASGQDIWLQSPSHRRLEAGTEIGLQMTVAEPVLLPA